MPTKTVSKGITRFDIENRGGYMVRISRKGERNSRYFSDTTYGGKRKAFAAAKEAYEALLEELGPAENATRDRMTSRNSTGIVGVHVAYTNDTRYPGCEYYAYCASWVDESGKRKKVSFAWTKYGEEASLELATLARKLEITERDKVVAIYEKGGGGKKAKASKRQTAASRNTSVKQAAKRTAKKPVKKTAKKSAKKPATRSARKVAKKSVQKSPVATAKRAGNSPTVKKKTAKKSCGKRR